MKPKYPVSVYHGESLAAKLCWLGGKKVRHIRRVSNQLLHYGSLVIFTPLVRVWYCSTACLFLHTLNIFYNLRRPMSLHCGMIDVIYLFRSFLKKSGILSSELLRWLMLHKRLISVMKELLALPPM